MFSILTAVYRTASVLICTGKYGHEIVTSLSNRPAPALCTYLHKKKPPLRFLRRTPSPLLMQTAISNTY